MCVKPVIGEVSPEYDSGNMGPQMGWTIDLREKPQVLQYVKGLITSHKIITVELLFYLPAIIILIAIVKKRNNVAVSIIM